MAAQLKEMGGEFVRFFVVGVGATVLHMGVYIGVNNLFGITEDWRWAWNASYAFGYVVSFLVNYVVTLKWTFKTEGSAKKGAGFVFSHAFNMGFQLLLLNFFSYLGLGALLVALVSFLFPWLPALLPFLSQPESLLPLPVYCIVVPTNFLMVRFFVKG